MATECTDIVVEEGYLLSDGAPYLLHDGGPYEMHPTVTTVCRVLPTVPVRFLEIDQPVCEHAYGTSPCEAALGVTGQRKCFNTRRTCQDPQHYSPRAEPETLRYTFDDIKRGNYGYVIPSLVSIDTAPYTVNICGMDRNVSPFGQREVVTVRLTDHLDGDRQVDPYRHERRNGAAQADGVGYDPYQRGTYWGKWLARNPYFTGYNARIREGVEGQPLEEMDVRHYVIDKISGPSEGSVQITLKDLFSRVEARKAVAPMGSNGHLDADIGEADTSAILSPAGIGNAEYPPSGHVRIGGEIIAYTRFGDALTLTQRGAMRTPAESHSEGDAVQLVMEIGLSTIPDIVRMLLVTYAGIDPSLIDKAAWDAEAEELFDYNYSAVIAEPTPVSDLIGELAEQAGFTLWPDIWTGQIRMAGIRPDAAGENVDDDGWILSGTYRQQVQTEKRLSEVWVYYHQIDPTKGLDEPTNFASRFIYADLSASSPEQYGAASVRRIYSRWIPERPYAVLTANTMLSLFRDPPTQVQFDLFRNQFGKLKVAENFRLTTRDQQDDTGAPSPIILVPTQVRRSENLESIRAQTVRLGLPPPMSDHDLTLRAPEELDINIREWHDEIYNRMPTSGRVIVTVRAGVIVGATRGPGSSTGGPAIRTGDWPPGIELHIIVEAGAFVVGAGGRGGWEGQAPPHWSPQAGSIALHIAPTADVHLDNQGVIGGGGGGGGWGELDEFQSAQGGAGAGFQRTGGATLESGQVVVAYAGNGGDLGQPGASSSQSGAAGGAAISLAPGGSLTYINAGDIRGAHPPP